MEEKNKKETTKVCAFCGKDITESGYLLTGNNASLCPDCIKEAYKAIIERESQPKPTDMTGIPKPKEIKEFLDLYVIGQERAKERISVAVYNHYKRIRAPKVKDDIDIEKSNILIVGPTGTGKTYIAKTIAKMLDVPFAIADATTLTEAGYVGEDVESIITKLLQAADYDVEKCQHGIVFVDEIDKIARSGGANRSITRDVSGEGVQQALLKMLEGSVVNVMPQGGRKHPEAKTIQVDTKDILFICGGAFDGISNKIKSRKKNTSVGFAATEFRNNEDEDKKNPLSDLTPKDLKDFGLIPELIGRIPIVTYMDELDKDALIKILNEPKNALVKQYKKLLSFDGVDLKFEDSVFEYIVEKTIENNLGARGLRGTMENLMEKIMYNVPSDNPKEFIVTLEYAKSQLEESKDAA